MSSQSSAPAGTVVVLAAGRGTRMRSRLPKVLHRVCGRTLLGWVLDQARSLSPERVVLVLGDEPERVQAELGSTGELEAFSGSLGRGAHGPALELSLQVPQLGTGHAVRAAAEHLEHERGTVTVLYGDMPLLTRATLAALLAARPAGGASLLTCRVPDPSGYGRVVRAADGAVTGIVEHRDASPDELAIDEINVGVYALPGERLAADLAALENDNAQGEYYLTDVIGALVKDGSAVTPVEVEHAEDAAGVNTLKHLADVRRSLQERILLEHLDNGVRIEDPDTTYIDHGVTIGSGTTILPCTVIRGGVTIGSDCEVGPFSHLRVGSVLADTAEVGNFTETKQATLGAGTKAKHLSYLGDVEIGARANIGAGTIVANYDGVNKHKTRVGDEAFVGSGSILIAPCEVGRGALTGAGAVLRPNSAVGASEAWVGVPARSVGTRKPVAKVPRDHNSGANEK